MDAGAKGVRTSSDYFNIYIARAFVQKAPTKDEGRKTGGVEKDRWGGRAQIPSKVRAHEASF